MQGYTRKRSKCSTKNVLEWITTICSTLTVIGVAILVQSSFSRRGNNSQQPQSNAINPNNDNNYHYEDSFDDYSSNNDNNNDVPISSGTSVGMLNGAVILVTGAGSGIGMATAHAVLRECGNVILLGRNSTKINNVYTNYTNNYLSKLNYCNKKPQIMKVIADIKNITQLRNGMDKIYSTFGRLDGCANIAGISGPIDYIDSDYMDDWLFSINDPIYNNLYGTIQSIRAEIEFFKSLNQRNGVIVNAASQNSFEGCAQGSLYVSSKFGIAGVTKSVALSYAVGNELNGNLTLRVNAVAPGMIDTPLTRNQARAYQGLQPFECFDPLNHSKILSYGCPDISETDPLYLKFKQDLLNSGTIPIERIIAPQEIANVMVFLLSNYSTAVTGDIWLADGGGTAA